MRLDYSVTLTYEAGTGRIGFTLCFSAFLTLATGSRFDYYICRQRPAVLTLPSQLKLQS
jgi:hypothetical protein